MATSGSVTVDLNNIRDIVNNTTETGSEITTGIADEGSLMGTAIGVTIAVLLFVGLISAVFGIIFLIFKFVKSLTKNTKNL